MKGVRGRSADEFDREGTVKIRRGGIHDNDTVEVCGGVSRGALICNVIRYACGKDEGYAQAIPWEEEEVRRSWDKLLCAGLHRPLSAGPTLKKGFGGDT